jgi:hypothetical protein
LSIPLAKVPPFLVAAIAVSSKVTPDELRKWHDIVQKKLTERNLHILSYNTDGASVERTISRSLQNQSLTDMCSWKFPHPMPGQPAIMFETIYLDNRKPQVISSDGKHWRKNARNGAQSGARILTLGQYTIHMGLLVTMVRDNNSPLLATDVCGVDKQDDRAAARLMSAAVIEHLSHTQPHELGLIIYLFIMGEMIDAQQNRALSHGERIQMLLRGYFFLEGWRDYIMAHEIYSINTHFISYPLYEVLCIYIKAMVMLVLAHRDFFPGIPLLPWLHSTETCEHYFGCARKIQQDFTFAEFILMVPKLSLLVRGEMQAKLTSTQADSSEGRSGYYHTWYDTKGVDPAKLAQYPSDLQVSSHLQAAYHEAHSLLNILGIVSTPATSGPLVDVRAFHESLKIFSHDVQDPDNDLISEDDIQYDSHGQQLAGMLTVDAEDTKQGRSDSEATNQKMAMLGLAATAAKVHDALRM